MDRQLVDQWGKPFRSPHKDIVAENRALRRQVMRAKFDAAQEGDALVRLWANADHLDPNSAASYAVRRKLRSRSRYEIIENNPYLLGAALSLANDFAGKGPRLRIIEKRINKDRRRALERIFRKWCKRVKLRQKLWRLRLDKLSGGEGMGVFRTNHKLRHQVKLDLAVFETDCCTDANLPMAKQPDRQVDGVRLDDNGEPTEYHVLKEHPGCSSFQFVPTSTGGRWYPAEQIIHWRRQERAWLRGRPELTPSLPLCALLRRYSLAVVKAAEAAADPALVLETQAPPSATQWGEEEDDPFDTFPVEQGMFTTLPWGSKLSQVKAEQPTSVYDKFVDALLREIFRPALMPFNRGTGSSRQSNMASAVVDDQIYKGGQESERTHCEEEVLEQTLDIWWHEFVIDPGEDGAEILMPILMENPSLRHDPPEHEWGWDQVGIVHTDPQKVANSLVTLRDKHILLDSDIQERHYNRDYEDWQEQVAEELAFRESLGIDGGDPNSQPIDDFEEDEDDEEDAELEE